MSPLNAAELKRIRFLLGCSVASAILLWGASRYRESRQKPPLPLKPFSFPTPELASLNRDLQARFAVVPDKDFGIVRAYGNQHYLYNPQTPTEKTTIAALKNKKTDAAFYLMSRALWLRAWDGAGYKPIQGPVHLTGKITLPLPRAINFYPTNNKTKERVIDQEQARGMDGKDGLTTHNPDGTPVSSPTPPLKAPSVNALQEIGNRVFELAEEYPHNAKIGISRRVNKRWKVVAVPIRANKPACISCHIYRPLGPNPNATSRTTIEVGDALGVAFYLYAVAEKQQKQQKPSATPPGAKAALNGPHPRSKLFQ
ncbi:hypothetical protein EON83_05850 [bacterium]|nr:MAG: hypothetical protein EON83_05850 [bacterium]